VYVVSVPSYIVTTNHDKEQDVNSVFWKTEYDFWGGSKLELLYNDQQQIFYSETHMSQCPTCPGETLLVVSNIESSRLRLLAY
jgi:hypothetical protein